MSSQGINIGDAVLSFIGDTTNLDETFASLPSKAKAGLQPVKQEIDSMGESFTTAGAEGEEVLGSQIPEAAELTRKQMSEARGEVRLLGEEFGIHLPRHVASFVAEMPGVGEVLSAAFSATAVLFLIQALVEGSEKLSNFVAGLLYLDTVNKQVNASIAATNKLFEELAATYKRDKEALDNFGKSVAELDAQKMKSLNGRMQESIALHASLQEQAKSTELNYSKWGTVIDFVTSRFGLGTPKLTAALAEQENAVQEAQAKAAAELKNQTNIQLETDLQREQSAQHAHDAKMKQIELEAAAENARADLAKKSAETEIGAEVARIKLYQAETLAEAEAENARAKLAKDQTLLEAEAENARADLAHKQEQLESEAEDARAKLYAREKKELEDLKKQNANTFAEMRSEWMKSPQALGHLVSMSEQAFNTIEKGMQNALASAILSQEGFGKAAEKATAQALASLAAQAVVKALFYTAEGVSDLFTPGAQGLAAGMFQAAALMAGVAGAAGVSARALNGAAGGSGGNSTTQGQSSSVNTGGSTRSTIGVTGVQKFAEGGLISAPTLAMIGEKPGSTEAVLPLDDPSAMERVGKAIGGSGGGGDVHHHTHINVKGLVSPDNLGKVINQINKRVSQGRSNLNASNSFRITKRSA